MNSNKGKQEVKFANTSYDKNLLLKRSPSYPLIKVTDTDIKPNPDGVVYSNDLAYPIIAERENNYFLLAAPKDLVAGGNKIDCRLATKYALKGAKEQLEPTRPYSDRYSDRYNNPRTEQSFDRAQVRSRNSGRPQRAAR